MLSGLTVLIVSPNQLQAIGLKYILDEYFSPDLVILSSSPELPHLHKADIIFLPADLYALHESILTSFRKKIILLLDQAIPEPNNSFQYSIAVTTSESILIDKIESIFTSILSSHSQEKPVELTSREIEVLKLVAKGLLNKQIADKLSISLHTVISHRKNITRKLGIKTVPGLTLYALMNGLISSNDIK